MRISCLQQEQVQEFDLRHGVDSYDKSKDRDKHSMTMVSMCDRYLTARNLIVRQCRFAAL